VTDNDHMGGNPEAGSDIENEIETSPVRQLADRPHDGGGSWNPETAAPSGSVGRPEAVVERHWKGHGRQPAERVAERSFKGGVGEQGRVQASIEGVVIRVAADMAGVAKSPHQGNPAANSRGDTQEVIVGEVADHEITRFGESAHSQHVPSETTRRAPFREVGESPRTAAETSLEIATSDEEEPRLDPDCVQGAAAELGHRAGTGPLVGEDNEAHPHMRTIERFPRHRAAGCGWRLRVDGNRGDPGWQTAGLRVVCGGAGAGFHKRGRGSGVGGVDGG
jgi:hypothetical protein